MLKLSCAESDPNAKLIADTCVQRGWSVHSEASSSPGAGTVLGSLFINGDGYQHHLTRSRVQRLSSELDDRDFYYLHIDAHDDLDGGRQRKGDGGTYRDFVSGIAADIGERRTLLLAEPLDRKRRLIQEVYNPVTTSQGTEWSHPLRLPKRGERLYISIDLDCVDSGVHTLFPRPVKSGFTVDTLLARIDEIVTKYLVLAADLCGFSLTKSRESGESISREVLDESLEHVLQVVETLSNAPKRSNSYKLK